MDMFKWTVPSRLAPSQAKLILISQGDRARHSEPKVKNLLTLRNGLNNCQWSTVNCSTFSIAILGMPIDSTTTFS